VFDYAVTQIDFINLVLIESGLVDCKMVYVWIHKKSYLDKLFSLCLDSLGHNCFCVCIDINKFDYRGTIIEPNIDLGVHTWYQT